MYIPWYVQRFNKMITEFNSVLQGADATCAAQGN